MFTNDTGHRRHFSGELLRKYRTEAGLTLVQAAALAGVIWQQWQKWELGKARPNADTVALLADVVRCEFIDQLYDYPL